MPNWYTNNAVIESTVDFGMYRGQLTKHTNDGTVTLNTTSTYYQIFDGTTTGRKLILPDATNFSLGYTYRFLNNTTFTVPVYYPDSTTSFPINLLPGTRTSFVLYDNTSSKGSWLYDSVSSASVASFSFLAQYGGNANTGRYMEIVPSIASNEAPYLLVSNAAIVALSLGATALSTGVVGIFKSTDLVNPITTLSLSNTLSNTAVGLFVQLSVGDKLVVQVTTGTILKPYMVIYVASI